MVVLGYSLGYLLIYRKALQSRSKAQFPFKEPCRNVDLIIPVKNEDLLLRRKLSNLMLQTYPHRLLNVIIVDSSTKDTCEQVVREFYSKNPDIHFVFIKDEDRRGKTNALNKAFRRCTGEICVITDVDVLIDKDAISNLVENFDNPQIGAVSGIEILVDEGRNKFNDLSIYRNFYNTLRIAESNIDSVLMCESELAAYRRNLLNDLPDITQCDDIRLTLNVRSKGYRAIYDPYALFYEAEGVNRREMLKQKIRRARANVHELLRNMHLVFSRRFGKFSRIILPFEIFLNLIAPILLSISAVTGIFLLLNPSTMIIPIAMLSVLAVLATWAGGFSNGRYVSLKDSFRKGIAFLSAFVEFNAILVVALILVLVRGPQTSWNPIIRGIEDAVHTTQ
jgi:cellulose synthase/poly-beta-1,6-N-acetylglucosamine synthase-like glycosyltransferase